MARLKINYQYVNLETGNWHGTLTALNDSLVHHTLIRAVKVSESTVVYAAGLPSFEDDEVLAAWVKHDAE